MDENALKAIADIICSAIWLTTSALWLITTGSLACLVWFFALLESPNSSHQTPAGYWSIEIFGYRLLEDIRPWIIPGYLLLGVGPVIGLALLMKKVGLPVGLTHLIGLETISEL